MSIKILFLTENQTLLNEIQKNYASQIESEFFKIFSPKEIDLENHYDLILGEEKYMDILSIKNIPIIILSEQINEELKEKNKNFYFIQAPVDWQNLYDQIISLQYGHKNQEIALFHRPEILNIIQEDEQKTSRELINEIKTESTTKIKNQLSTKIYDKEDLKKITKVLEYYGEENFIDKKIIAQASIILDELVFSIKDINNIINPLWEKDPAVLLQMENKEGFFTMNLECKIKANQFEPIVEIAQRCGETVRSFERNSNNILKIEWRL